MRVSAGLTAPMHLQSVNCHSIGQDMLRGGNMNFAEELPDSCPPADAEDRELENVYRLASNSTPSVNDFASHAALGKTPPKSLGDPCRWASCSLTTDPAKLKKLSKLKHRFAVRLKIPSGSGLSKSRQIHIDFWRASGFDPLAAIEDIEDL